MNIFIDINEKYFPIEPQKTYEYSQKTIAAGSLTPFDYRFINKNKIHS